WRGIKGDQAARTGARRGGATLRCPRPCSQQRRRTQGEPEIPALAVLVHCEHYGKGGSTPHRVTMNFSGGPVGHEPNEPDHLSIQQRVYTFLNLYVFLEY